ncbi:MAG: PAS domain-containing protein, partial [Gammaproteobacteria bacterium]|nr:PAS domain-containing protein [Gammaproteobacteria bacterium]
MAAEYQSASVLSHFDPAELLDALTTGILMLDAQLCPIYANVAAQDLLGFSLNMSRGRPFGDFLHDAGALHTILRRALDTGECLADRELTLKSANSPREPRTLDVTVTPLLGLTGTHLLIELADTTQRQRISRDNDLLARLDGSRLMIRQLAHEIKNPLGGLRGAAQLLERELPAPSLREYTRVIIGEADRLTALV